MTDKSKILDRYNPQKVSIEIAVRAKQLRLAYEEKFLRRWALFLHAQNSLKKPLTPDRIETLLFIVFMRRLRQTRLLLIK